MIVVAIMVTSGLAGIASARTDATGPFGPSSVGPGTATQASAPSEPVAAVASIPHHSATAPASLSSPPTLSAGPLRPATFPTVRMGSFHVPGPHPQSWGGSAVPPGAPFPAGAVPAAPGTPSGSNSSENSSVFWSGHCAGLYPFTGNATYYDGCVGHDEPGIQFYSDAPGSAGNITWNVTLPVDAGPSHNQSNLYVAIWFGMTLSDRLAWLDQCFLELQLYPDSSWGAPAVSGEWIGAAVAWQIEAATGYEDPCYYSPLYLHGMPSNGYFNMTGGDQLTVTMSGWQNDPWGENITLVDRTQGTESNLTLFDPYGSFPLDPAYATNSYENGLQWTPGGEYPAVFAFETGHGRNPNYPTNTTFNYCTPGPPPATAVNPNVPCPSYDPGSWANDTLKPWRIAVPTFGSAGGTAPAAQVAFTQDLGGIELDAGTPGCPGNLGSAYCSYPWYSYSCSTHSFQFGATDYPGVSEDFGKYLQYAPSAEVNDLGFGYYPPTNFTIPACGAPTATVNLNVTGSIGGTVYFLSHPYGGPASLAGLALGAYALHAISTKSSQFAGWTVTGDLAVDGGAAAWTTLWVNGSGTVTAVFRATAPNTTVAFDDQGAAGAVAVLPSYLFSEGGIPIATETNGGTLALPDQIYSVMAYAPPGYNFTHWSTNGSGAIIAAPELPDSWLVVTGSAPQATVTAWYASSASQSALSVGVSGNGTVNLSGTTGSSFSELLAVGTYPVAALSDPGWAFQGWYAGGSDALPDQGPVTNLTLETGSAVLYAYFVQLPVTVFIEIWPSSAGAVYFLPSQSVTNDSSVKLPIGLDSVSVIVQNGFEFMGWTVNQSGAAWPESPLAAVSPLLLNRTVTLIAHFAYSPLVNVSFLVDPPAGGSIEFNFDYYANGWGNSTSNGSYMLAFIASPGFSANGYNTSGPVSVGVGVLLISGGGGTLTAKFAPIPAVPVAVTFVSEPVGQMTARLNGTALATGDTLWLVPGIYSLLVTTSPQATFVNWTAAGGLEALGSGPNRSLNISQGGTIYALGVPFVVTNISVGPPVVDVGFPVHFTASALGSGRSATSGRALQRGVLRLPTRVMGISPAHPPSPERMP
ncbi:MAG: InlB B-repeat-containing protein [Thermoplasmata archaeon]